MSPSNRITQLYSHTPDSPSTTRKGYGGGILTLLHTGFASISKPLYVLAIFISNQAIRFFGSLDNFFTEQGRQPWVPTLYLQDQVSVFMSPSDKLAWSYLQASPLFDTYVSQDYGWGNLTGLHLRFNSANKPRTYWLAAVVYTQTTRSLWVK
jgi:hypothetical protein